jgi:sulfide dehydrogenase cytochrome subunit
MDKKTATMLALALAASCAAQAQNRDVLYVRSLAATCANCHGTQGQAQPAAPVPGLAGLPREHIAERMRGFKAGRGPDPSRPPTIMHQIAKGYSDAQIDQLAAYFSALPK